MERSAFALLGILAVFAVPVGCGGGATAVAPRPPAPTSPEGPAASASAASAARSADPALPPFERAPACPARAASAPAQPSTGALRQILDGRHAGPIVALAFSPDGRWLASASNDGSVRVWDAATRDILRVTRRVGQYTSLGWGDDTHVAYRGLGPDPELYDVAGGSVGAPFPGVGFTQALTRAPAATGGAWIASAYRRVSVLDGKAQKLYDFQLSAGGDKLGDNRDRLYFAADAASVAAAYAKDAIVVRGVGKADADRVVPVAGAEQIGGVALTPDGARAVVSYQIGSWSHLALVATQAGAAAEALAWPPALGLQLANGTSNGGGPPVASIAATSRFAAAATTQGLFVWDLGTKKLAWSRAVPPELGVPLRERDDAERVTFSPDGSLVACGTTTGRLLVYDAASGRLQGELGSKARAPVSVAFQDPTHLAVLATDAYTHRSNLGVWSLSDARLALSKPSADVEAMAVAPTGAIATLLAPQDGACAAGFTRSLTGGAQKICTPGAMSGDPWMRKTEMSPRSNTALVPVGINPRAILDLRKGGLTRLEQTDTPQVLLQRAALSPDGAWVVGYTVDTVYVWNARTGKIAQKIPLDKRVAMASTPTALAISEDSRAFVVAVPQFASPNTFLLTIDMATGKPVGQAGLIGLVTAVAFGESRSTLVVGGIGGARGSVVVLRDGQIVASSKDDADLPWQVTVDPSHKIAATLSQDGGVRVWDLGTAALRATLAEFEDGEWIAATPGGAYAGTGEVASRIGWVFEGPLERFGFEQFSASFRDPGTVGRRLAGDAVDTAARPQRPPSVALVSAPAHGQRVDAATASLKIHAGSWDQVDVVRVFADGRPVAEKAICAKEGDVTVDVPLLPGTNHVSALAFDARGFASNEAWTNVDAAPPNVSKPDVWVVAVGVGNYKNLPPQLHLDGPPGDAAGIAALFKGMEGTTYAHAHVRQLVDDEATPTAIREAIAGLSAMQPADVGVVFLAGHGLKPSEAADMIFATSGFGTTPDGKQLDPASFTRDAVTWKDLAGAIEHLKGRVLVMLDACHSGHFSQGTVVENDDLAASLVHDQRAGGVVFAASKGRQFSYEPDNARALALDPGEARAVKLDPSAPHGFFTGALLAAVGDPMTDRNGDGAVQLSELIDEVSRRVAVASKGQQTPWVARRELFGDFAIAAGGRR
jgi:WD40 repeat protein